MVIAGGEKTLSYKLQVVNATDYLEFDRSSSRYIMPKPFGEKVCNLEGLIIKDCQKFREIMFIA